jgi:hypothetical protein
MLVDPHAELSNAFCLLLQPDDPLIEQANKQELAVRAVFP